jgi:hypothetical protein
MHLPTFVASVTLIASTALAGEPPRLSTARSALDKAQADFRGCKNGKLEAEFAAPLVRLEQARKTLEKGRRQLESDRRSLEAERARIEAGHHVRHESAEEREEKERHYLERLERDYRAPMAQLSSLTAEYASGIIGYSNVLEKVSTYCAQTGITTATARAFVSGLSGDIDAVSAQATKLVDDATAAAGTKSMSAK